MIQKQKARAPVKTSYDNETAILLRKYVKTENSYAKAFVACDTMYVAHQLLRNSKEFVLIDPIRH
jgi:hypothetical protein